MRPLLCLSFLLCLTALPSTAQPPKAEVVESKGGVVVCVSPPAADVGLTILKKGGNAVDAAVAVAFAMAVTWPEAGNIGGGGFMMVADPGQKPTCFEYRETAPAAAKANLFADGKVTWLDHKAAGVPGRFGEAAAALPDRKAQRKADAAAGLVPFACKLPAPLAQQLRDRAASHAGGINGLVAELLARGLG